MKKMSTAEIREAFQKYFESQGHTRVESASLVPTNDPTLLFTAAGMVQFKDCFLGLDRRPYVRATSAQKCVRAGGKHNDLENVGFTARHHTFFEMLGNFSFGDYFKREAIHFAWEFTTKVLGLPKDRLRVSVYEKDDESAEIWHKQEGVPLDRIVRFGEADNFWSAGDTGPCGPCSEIFWDQGQEVDGDRWLEFWNCVFMQYDRAADGTLTPLPKPSVDTGMGLERMAAIMQNVPTNYDIDLMQGLVQKTVELVNQRTKQNLKYVAGDNSWQQSALKVIVDHLRATSFLIADGVLPSNEGRGYVLRRILRRAVRFGKRLGLKDPFLKDLFPALMDSMGGVYPELKQRQTLIQDVLGQEESKFFETLDRGLLLLDEAFAKLSPSDKTLPADVVFKLYDTFGFPVDLTALIAREKNLAIDETGVQKLMGLQQEKSRASWKGSGDSAALASVKEWKNQGIAPSFTGYSSLVEKSKVTALSPGQGGAWVSIEPCPFYGEAGGQAGDTGELVLKDGKKLRVVDSQKPYEGGIAIYVEDPNKTLKVGDLVEARVDTDKRAQIRANHTATHLLHAALREVLGTHVGQAGSLVNAEKLRFDFSHSKGLSPAEIKSVEDWVNNAIEKNTALSVESTSYKDAIAKGAMALFGEKYGDVVRMVQVPGFSTELCGGTHVSSTGEIRLFKILSESAVAAGVRRIEAVSSHGALDWYQNRNEILSRVANRFKIAPDAVEERVEKLFESQKQLEREIESLRRRLAEGNSDSKTVNAKYKGQSLEIHSLVDADAKFLREKADALRKSKSDVIHVLVSGTAILVTVDNQKLPQAHAGNLLKEIATAFGGRGGGQAQTAQGQLPVLADVAAALSEWAAKA